MRRVLCVDDEQSIVDHLCAVVRLYGLSPVPSTDALQALGEIVDPSILVVLADFMMPGMNGIELLAQVRRLRPDVRRVLFTAAPHDDAVLAAVQDGTVTEVIAKPPTIADFHNALTWFRD